MRENCISHETRLIFLCSLSVCFPLYQKNMSFTSMSYCTWKLPSQWGFDYSKFIQYTNIYIKYKYHYTTKWLCIYIILHTVTQNYWLNHFYLFLCFCRCCYCHLIFPRKKFSLSIYIFESMLLCYFLFVALFRICFTLNSFCFWYVCNASVWMWDCLFACPFDGLLFGVRINANSDAILSFTFRLVIQSNYNWA